MQALFDAAWSLLNIKITYEGITIAVWHPIAFTFLIGIIFKILTFRSKED